MTIKISYSVEVPVFIDALQKRQSWPFFILPEDIVASMHTYNFFIALPNFLGKERGLVWHWHEMINIISSQTKKDVVLIFPWDEELSEVLDDLVDKTPNVERIEIGVGDDYTCTYDEEVKKDIKKSGPNYFDYVMRKSISIIGPMKY